MISKSIINKLKEKGVAADIILDMILEDEQEEQKPETDQKAEQKPAEQKPEPEKKPDPEPEKKPDPDPILAAINKLTGAIQASNILNSGSQGPAAETSQDILAQLINPKGGNNNG